MKPAYDDEDDAWTVYGTTRMLAKVAAAQAELDALSRPFCGSSDGWARTGEGHVMPGHDLNNPGPMWPRLAASLLLIGIVAVAGYVSRQRALWRAEAQARAQAAAELKIPRSRMLDLIATGPLRVLKLGRDWPINLEDLAAVRIRKPGRPKAAGKG